jgi:sugar lactone lactonase YvrE
VWYDDRLLWVDIGTTTVHRLDPATGKQESTRVDRAVGALAPDLLGTVVTATDAGLARLSNGTLESLAEVEAEDPGTRMNDGKVGPAGRFLAGTIALNLAEGAGSMYSLQPDHSVRTVLSGLTVSNGLGWSPNGKSLYSIESFNFGVDPYDYDVAWGSKLVFPLSWSAVFAAWRTNQPPSIRRMDGDHFSYLLQADLTGLFTDIMAGGGDRVV